MRVSFRQLRTSRRICHAVHRSERGAFFPLGTPNLFKTFFAPADYIERINTLGLPGYAKAIPSESRPFRAARGPGDHLSFAEGGVMPALLDRTTDALEPIAAAGLTPLQAEVAHIMAVVRNKLADMIWTCDWRICPTRTSSSSSPGTCGSATTPCHIPGLSRFSVPLLFREPSSASASITSITVDIPTMIYPIAVCGRDRTSVQVSAPPAAQCQSKLGLNFGSTIRSTSESYRILSS